MKFSKSENVNTLHGELLFISDMRAMATVAVMFWHLGVVFWYSNGAVANLCHFEVMADIESAVPKIYTDIVTAISALNIDLGMFGVAIFFLISGFIIPFSVRGRNPEQMKGFLLKRFLRVWPMYVVGFSITFLVISFYLKYMTGLYPYRFSEYIVQASLLRDWFWVSSIDGISWTLEIEIKFYVLFYLLYILKWDDKPKAISGVAAVTALGCILYNANQSSILEHSRTLYIVCGVLAMSMMYIVFILIGVVIYQYYEKNWDLKTSLIVGEIVAFCFIVSVLNSSSANLFNKFIVNYGGAFLVFSNFYLLRDRFRKNVFLDFFAKHSYIIYIVHGVNGYVLLHFFNSKGLPFLISLPLTVIIVLCLAILLRRFVEIPFNNFVKSFMRKNEIT